MSWEKAWERYKMKKMSKLLIIIVVAIIILGCIAFIWGDDIGHFITGYRDIDFNCDGTGSSEIYVAQGCYESNVNEYRFVDGPCILSGMYGTISTIEMNDYNYVVLELLNINDEWIEQHAFVLDGTTSDGFELALFGKTAFGFRFIHIGPDEGPDDIFFNIATYGNIEIDTEVVEECNLIVYVEEYVDGPPVVGVEVNLQSIPTGYDVTETTNVNGFVNFSVFYGNYVLTVEDQVKDINLNTPTMHETITLDEEPQPFVPFNYVPYLLLFLVLVFVSTGIVIYFVRKKRGKKP